MSASTEVDLKLNIGIFDHINIDEFRCRICTADATTPDWRQHAASPRHAATLRQFVALFGDRNAEGAACRFCGVAVAPNTLRNHAAQHKIVPWYEPPDTYRSFFRNHIREWDSRFYCYACDELFPEWSTAYLHIDDERHRRLGSAYHDETDSFAAQEEISAPYKLLVKENFRFGPGDATVTCDYCKCLNIDLKNVADHVRGKQHSMTNAYHLRRVENCWKELQAQPLRDSQGAATHESLARIGSCNSAETKDSSLDDELPSLYVVERNDRDFACKICDLKFTSRGSVEAHVEGSLHVAAFEKYGCGRISVVESDYVYHCESCDCQILGVKNVRQHVRGSRHRNSVAEERNCGAKQEERNYGTKQEVRNYGAKQEVRNYGAKEETRNNDSTCWPDSHVVRVDDKEFYCNACDAYVPWHTIDVHVAGKTHAFATRQWSRFVSFTEGNNYHCSCCDCRLPGLDNVYGHLRGNRHAQSLYELENPGEWTTKPAENFAETTFLANNNSLPETHVEKLNSWDSLCRLCDVVIKGVSNVRQHETGERHSYWEQQLSENISFKGGNSYYCKLCDCSPPGLENVYRHLRGYRHEQMLYDLENEERAASDENFAETSFLTNNNLLPENHVEKLNSSDSHCRLCDVVIKGVSNVRKHVTGEDHSYWEQQLSENITFKGGNRYYCKLCDCSPPGLENVYRHLRGNRHDQSLYNLENEEQAASDETSAQVEDFVEPSSLSNNASLPETHVEKLNSSDSHCRLCDVVIKGVSNVQLHVTSEDHSFWAQQLSENITFKGGNRYHCKLCDCSPPGLENVYRHLRGNRHEQSLYDLENEEQAAIDETSAEAKTSKPAENVAETSLPETHVEKLNSSDSHCRLCDVVIKGVSNVRQHVTGENHSFWAQQFAENMTFKSGNSFHCKICDCSPPGLENVYRHLRGSRHEQSMHDLKSQKQQRKKDKLAKPESLNDSNKLKSTIDSNQSKSAIDSNQSNQKTPSLPSDASFPKDHLQSLGNDEFHCRLCDEVDLDKSSIHEHLTSQRHQSNARSLSKNVSFTWGNQYRCKPCNCMIPGVENIYRHVNGVRHAKALGDLEKRDRANSRAEKNARTELPSVENASSSHDRNVEVSDSNSSSENCEDLAVGNQVAGFVERLTDEISSMGNDKYHCGRCNWTIYGVENFLAHLSGEKHRSLMKTSDPPRELKSNLNYDGRNCDSRAAIRNQPNFTHPLVEFVGIFCSVCYVRFASASELHSHLAIHVGEKFPSLVETAKVNGTINDSESEPKRKNPEDTGVSRSKKTKLALPSSASPKKNPPTGTPPATEINNFTSSNSEKFPVKVNGTINNSNSKPQGKNREDTAVSRSKKTELAIPSSPSSKKMPTAKTPTATEINDFTSSNSDKSSAKVNGTINKKTKPTITSSSSSKKMPPAKTPTASAIPPTSESAQENLAPNAEEDRRSPSKSSVNRRILQLLNADSDQIHGMRDKLERAKLGMRLCAITASGNAYCLICRKDVDSAPEKRLEHLDNVDHCEYLEGMEKDHALFELVPGQFSEFDLVSQYLEEVSNDLVRCRACDEDVGNADAALRRHIEGENHAQTREEMRLRAARDFQAIESRLRCDWYDIHRYWCVPCDEQFEAELGFARHLRSTGHAIVGRKSRNSERGLGYDFCAPCGILWFGFRFTQAKHCESLGHRWAISKGNREARELPKTVVSRLREVERVVEDETRILEKFYERARHEEELLRRDLELAAMDVFPGVKAFVCGSRASGLATGNNDLEIFLDCDNLYDGKQSSEDEILHLITSVHQWLDKHSRYWNVDEILSSSRSSVLKALHIPTGLTCEVSFENGLAVENSKLIRYYTDIFPLCRELMLFLNKWLVLCDLAGPQGISRQALHWYLIFYLQKESTVPSVASLIARKNVSRRIAGWEVGVSTDFANGAAANSNSSNLREVLTRFFAFCEKFDHRHDVACPLLGREIAKRAFADPQSLPEEMAPYVEYTKNSAQPRPFRIDCVMCIQDPFDLKRNLADSVSKVQLSRFRAFCSKSLNFLSS